MVDKINSIQKVSCLKPKGAFYVMMNIDQIIGTELYGKKIETADDFCTVMLDVAKVALVPCTSFGAPNYIRWSYATSMENIKRGLERLEKFLHGDYQK
ncbi:Aspartate aminotransferase [bioreactor metagenome]|uniref:Aspartate aminotransferase n=1 Tax=bioreactor metagenome TaxID=1076179 RepID=A0A645I5C9_9ZZZZ